jgi:hypothetical protein
MTVRNTFLNTEYEERKREMTQAIAARCVAGCEQSVRKLAEARVDATLL